MVTYREWIWIGSQRYQADTLVRTLEQFQDDAPPLVIDPPLQDLLLHTGILTRLGYGELVRGPLFQQALSRIKTLRKAALLEPDPPTPSAPR